MRLRKVRSESRTPQSWASTPNILEKWGDVTSSERHISRDELLVEERRERVLPLLINPFTSAHGGEAQKTPTWLELFFDLLFVACLSVLVLTHEEANGGSIGSLIAFIALLWWSHASEVFFSVRYARRDVWTRFMTFVFTAVFAFLGASSFGFRPNILRGTYNYALLGANEGIEPTAADIQAQKAWSAACLSFAVGRVVLGLQYLVVALCRGWRKPSAPILLPLFGCGVSGGIALGVHWIDASTERQNATRLGLLYGAIVLEMVIAMAVSFMKSPVPTHSALLLERFALLTLIILGEGYIGLVRNLANVLFHDVYNSSEFVQLFSVLALFFTVYIILYDPFNKEATMHTTRTHAYCLLNLPLHITLLLWIQGCVILLQAANVNQALILTLTVFQPILDQFEGYFSIVPFPSTPFTLVAPAAEIAEAVGACELAGVSFSSLNASMTIGAALINETGYNWLAANAGGNLTQYRMNISQEYGLRQLGGFLISLAQSYGLAETDTFVDLKEDVFAYSFTASNFSITVEDIEELSTSLLNAVIPAALWVLPCLGGILLMSVLLTVIQRPPKDSTDYLLLIPRGALGFALCMLGFLDFGQQQIEQQDFVYLQEAVENSQVVAEPGNEPLVYKLLSNGWLLPMQVLLLHILIAFETLVLWGAKRVYDADSGKGEKDLARASRSASQASSCTGEMLEPTTSRALAERVDEAPLP